MHTRSLMLALAIAAVFLGCGGGGGKKLEPLTGWAAMRAKAAPANALPLEFQAPHIQSIAVDGWEDGICISRDGLHLYALYAPADLLAFSVNGLNDQTHAADYLRGPTLGMDLTTTPVPGITPWIHCNIIHASRANTAVHFGAWQLTTMARPSWSEGAPLAQGDEGGTWDLFVYTTNDHAPDYKAHVALARHAAYNPAVLGALLPVPVTTPIPANSAVAGTTEDNPHIERLGVNDLVLFFDSDDRPGGVGAHDIWYTTSADDGVTWATPVALSLNSALEEEQPHLWRDVGGTWWLYYTATNPGDGKLGIFRAQQGTSGDWNNWIGNELVLGAGNTAGVGEPTLTAAGDLSFVVVMEDTVHGTPTNRYDADPWFMPRIPSAVVKRTQR